MSIKRSDIVFIGLAMATGAILGYVYGSEEGRRFIANSCIVAKGFIVQEREFVCQEVVPETLPESRASL